MPDTTKLAIRRRASSILAAAICGLSACAAPDTQRNERPFPSSWFLNQRLSADGAIPVRARARALEQARARGILASAPGSWLSAGPINIGGRVTALYGPLTRYLPAAWGALYHATNFQPVVQAVQGTLGRGLRETLRRTLEPRPALVGRRDDLDRRLRRRDGAVDRVDRHAPR